jgi:hypothetical protein
MAAQPEWYNAITNSCGVNIVQNAWAEGSERSLSWRLLLNGEWPRYAYDAGRLGSGKPFEQIFQECIINPRAQAAGYSPDFSRAIRNGPIVTFRVPRSFDPTKVPEIPPPGIDRPVK